MKMKLKVGDHVMVVSGKDKGKEGKILNLNRETGKVVVDGIALAKRARRGARGEVGSIVEAPRAIDASNVMYMDPKDKKPTRIRREMKDGKLVRVTVKSKTALS